MSNENKAMKLGDETLEKVSGGVAEVSDDPQANGRCPYCTTLLKATPYGYVCSECGSMFDGNMHQLMSNVNSVNDPVSQINHLKK